jgi:predicted amidohydrolase
MQHRRNFLRALITGVASTSILSEKDASLASERNGSRPSKAIPLALVQFDAVPEQIELNLQETERLAEKAVSLGARWVVFHENSLCDYTARVKELAEQVPEGPSTRRLLKLAQRLKCYLSFGLGLKLAQRLKCYLSFGLGETRDSRYYITQVFVGPEGFLYRYRKTWVWLEPEDKGYRNEWMRFDPGTGPELFSIDGVQATCFICADGEAARCIERAAGLKPQVVFYPNNRAKLPEFDVFGHRAKTIQAPMLVTNRVGFSWMHKCEGGCVSYSKQGEVQAKANREGQEEILLHNLEV